MGKERMSVCIDGSVTLPSMAIKNINQLKSEDVEFTYRNNIGFGQTCQEHTVKVTGSANVSLEQKRRIQQSEEVRKCIRTTEKVQEIREELQRTRIGSQQQQQLEEQQQAAIQKKIDHCSQAIRKMSTLDQAKFRIEYTPMPQYVRQYTRVVDTAVKALLLPYLVRSETTPNQHNQIEVELKFNPQLETVDMVLKEEEETNQYANIRLPEQVRNMVPLVASKSIQEQLIDKIEGGSVYPKCYIGDGAVKTFDNKTYSYELDDCYHVLAADCSKQPSHAVLGKVVGGKKHVQIFTKGSKILLQPASSYSQSRKEYEIIVDGKKITINKNQKEEVQSRDGQSSYNFYRSADNILVVETPYNRVTYDGISVEVESIQFTVNGKSCGLCGDKNGDRRADVKSAQEQIQQSAQAAALSYRVQQDSCSALSPQKQQLQQQQQKWQQQQNQQQQQQQIVKSPVSQIIQGQLEKCTQRKHSMIRQDNQVCISQIPIVECGSGCGPKSLVEKNVPFTCLPANRERVIKLYIEKVRRGELLPELRNMEKSFSSKMVVPVTCAHPGF